MSSPFRLDIRTSSVFSLAFPSIVRSTYTSSLNTDSGTYFGDVCGESKLLYYQALRMNISVFSEYGFLSKSYLGAYGSIYSTAFNPFYLRSNLIVSDEGGCGDGQFWLQAFLHSNTTYIFVVSKSASTVPEKFSIMSKGIGNVSFTNLGECACFRPTVLHLHHKALDVRIILIR